MKSYKNGDNSSENYSGGVYGGVFIALSTVASATNTALTEAAVDLFQLSVKCELVRSMAGKNVNHKIMEMQAVKPIAFASGIGTGLFGYISPANTGNNGYTIRTAAAVGVKEVGDKYIYIPFGGPVDTRNNGGKIVVSVQTRTLFGATTDTALSVVNVDLKQIEGVERFLPSINVEVIPVNQSELSLTFEGATRRISLFNFDKTGALTADMVCQQADVNAAGLNLSLTDQQLMTVNAERMSNLADSEALCQNYDLIQFNQDKFYENVQVQLALQSADVAASQNYIVCWGSVPNITSVMQMQTAQQQNETAVARALVPAEARALVNRSNNTF